MGVSINTSTKGNKKPLDAELNLIPFIDLLICCICFLLITAVWIQLAQIDVSQRSKRPGGEQVQVADANLTVLVGDDGYTLALGSERLVIPKQGHVYDTETLKKKLVELKSKRPDRGDLTVAAEDNIRYVHLIRTMDVALQSHFSQIRVSDAGARL